MAMYLMTTNGKHDIEIEPYGDINEARKQAKKCYGRLTKEELRHGADIEIWLDVDENWQENGNLDHNLDEEFEAWKAERA